MLAVEMLGSCAPLQSTQERLARGTLAATPGGPAPSPDRDRKLYILKLWAVLKFGN